MKRAQDGEAGTLFQRAVDLQLAGRVSEAIESYERALERDGSLVEAHNNLGTALLRIGEFERALLHYDRAIALRPSFASAYDNRGYALQRRGAFADAIAFHERAIALDARMPQAYYNLGHGLICLHREREAIAPLRRAIALQPNFKEAINSLGAAYQATGALDEAIDVYRKALALAPGYADAHCNLGTALREAGDIAEAEQCFQRAVELAPNNARFHRLLVDARVGPVDETQLRRMEALSAQSDFLPVEQRIELHFALAKAYDGLGAYDRSFANVHAGNALKRSITPYDEAKILGLFESLPQMFGEALLDALRGSGDPSPVPVFVFGMPRSGTTLVEQILAAHPGVCAAGELGAFEIAMSGFSAFEAGGEQNETAFRSLLARQFSDVGARYARQIESLEPSAVRITDKTPWNFRFAGVIHLALPNARMIHVRRAPLDTCLSCFFTLFSDHQPYAYDLAELGRYYRGYERLMDYWRAVLPEGAILEVRYEELVDDFERQARRIVAYCGLPWHESCKDFSAVKRPVRTASAVAVRQPLYRTAVGRAGRYSDHLGPLLAGLGLS